MGPVLAAGVALVVGLILSSCDSRPVCCPKRDAGRPKDSDDSPDAATELPGEASAETSLPAEVSETVQEDVPQVEEHGVLAEPVVFGEIPCESVDIDYDATNRLVGLCGKTKTFQTNSLWVMDVPKELVSSKVPTVADMLTELTDTKTGGKMACTVVPYEIWNAGGGRHIIPFNCISEGGKEFLRTGVAFMDETGEGKPQFDNDLFGPVKHPDGAPNPDIVPYKLNNCVETPNNSMPASKGWLRCLASDDKDRGMVFSWPLRPDGHVDQDPKKAGGVIFTGAQAKGPISMAMSAAQKAVVLNSSDVGDAPSLTEINFANSTRTYLEPANKKLGPVQEIPELKLTADGDKILFVTKEGKFSVFSRKTSLVGECSTELIKNVKDIAVSGTNAYVSTADKVYKVDISDAADPVIVKSVSFDAEGEFGTIEAGENGRVFVSRGNKIYWIKF